MERVIGPKGSSSRHEVVLSHRSVTDSGMRVLRCAWNSPVWIKEHKAVAADEVDATAAGLGGQQEHKLAQLRVELLHHLGALL